MKLFACARLIKVNATTARRRYRMIDGAGRSAENAGILKGRGIMSHDAKLQKAVMAQLQWDPSINAAAIGVTAVGGVVTLSGHVETFAEKHAADAATQLVKGVKAVAEEIEVRLAFDATRDDDAIAAAAIARLSWNTSVPQDAIKVIVEKGWIRLTGQVDWFYQRAAAEQDVRRLFGVRGVSNEISIKLRVDVSNISDDITHAMHQSCFFDPNTIAVTANHGRVLLKGSVHSPHERQVAAVTAWAAPGVTDVVNEIHIN